MASSLKLIIPEIGLLLLMVLLLSVFIFKKDKESSIYLWISLIGLGVYFVFLEFHYQFQLNKKQELRAFSGLLFIDKLSLFYKQLVVISTALVLIHIRVFKYKFRAEVFFLILAIVLGLCLASMSTHFIFIFIAIELVSLSSYVLVSLDNQASAYQATFKYFIIGGTSAAIMLYALSWVYGITQTLDFSVFTTRSFIDQKPIFIFILFTAILGLFWFKTAAAPLFSWAPEVYQFGPTPIISFISFAPKAVSFLIISRIVNLPILNFNFILIFIATLSLLIGNIGALRQNHSKKLMAYSGIAHTGFIIISLIVFKNQDLFALNFYMVAYMLMNIAAFWLIDLLYRHTNSFDISSYAGLAPKNIFLGINAIVIMVSLVGLPPTVGFTAKFILFSKLLSESLESKASWPFVLMFFGLINLAISIYYYLRIPYSMFIRSQKAPFIKTDSDFRIVILSYISFCLIFLFFYSDYISPLILGLSK